jgi:hypothetical protein
MDHDAFGRIKGRQHGPAGANVEVRTRYLDGQWAHGYEIAEILPSGYRVRRRGTGEVLSEVFRAADVRPDAGH